YTQAGHGYHCDLHSFPTRRSSDLVGANVPVQILNGTTMTVNGTLSAASGAVVTLNNNGYYYQVQINVGSGGLLSATNATLTSPIPNNHNSAHHSHTNVASRLLLQT